MRSRQIARNRVLSQSGAHDEYQRGTSGHSDSGLRTTVVSIIVNGAGSVDVSARPALPNTLSTSGNVRRILSCTCKSRAASVTDSPGSVVGIYKTEPSYSGGMNSEPSFR